MIYWKRYGIRFLMNLLEILGLFFLLSLLSYFNGIKDSIFPFLKFFVFLGTLFVNSFLLGREVSKKGYLEGMKYGMLFIAFFLLFSLLFSKFQIKNILYYFLILITTTLASMLGIQKKKLD